MEKFDLRYSILAVVKSEGEKEFAGTGFLAQDQAGQPVILTCAHVLEQALKGSEPDSYMIQFYFAREYCQARVVAFSPVTEYDVAVLTVTAWPEKTLALPLSLSQGCKNDAFSSLGYPQIGSFPQLNALGQIAGPINDDKMREFLQLRSKEVTNGYSGGPLWDEERQAVVGMINSGLVNRLGNQPEISFAIPSESLLKVWDQFKAGAAPASGGLPPGSYLPFRRNVNFTGRETALEKLEVALCGPSGTGALVTQAILGMGGIGKTQLAAQFGLTRGHLFDGVHWLNAAPPASADGNRPDLQKWLDGQIALCGAQMNLPGWPADEAGRASRTLAAWQSGGKRLIILDNFEAVPSARAVLPRFAQPNLRLLVTSRQADWPTDLGLQTLELELFSTLESRAFLRKHLVAERASEAELEALAARLGHLPLALELAARYLHYKALPVADYLQALNLEHASLVNWRAELGTPTDHETDVAHTFALSWEQLRDENTRWVFMLAGYYAPNLPLPLPALAFSSGLDESGLEDALIALRALSLLQANGSLHPLLAEFARLQDRDESLLFPWARGLARLTYPGMPGGGIYASPLLAAQARYALPDLRKAAQLKQDAETSTLCFHSAFLLVHFGDLDGAMKLYQQSLDIKEGLGDLQGKSATLANMGIVLFQNQRYTDALKSLLMSLDILSKLGAKLNIETVVSLLRQFRQAVGAQKFLEMWQQVTGNADLPDWLTGEPEHPSQ